MNTKTKMARFIQQRAHGFSNNVSRWIGDTSRNLGIPTKQDLAERWLRRRDPDAEARIGNIQHALSNPTMMDAVAKDILNTHDT